MGLLAPQLLTPPMMGSTWRRSGPLPLARSRARIVLAQYGLTHITPQWYRQGGTTASDLGIRLGDLAASLQGCERHLTASAGLNAGSFVCISRPAKRLTSLTKERTNMDRRKFITTSGAGAAAAAATVLTNGPLDSNLVEAQARPARKPLLLKLGSNCSAYNEAELVRVGRFGVKSIVSGVTRADATKLGVTTETGRCELPENTQHGPVSPPHLLSHIAVSRTYISGQSPEPGRSASRSLPNETRGGGAGSGINYTSPPRVLRTGPPGPGRYVPPLIRMALAKKMTRRCR